MKSKTVAKVSGVIFVIIAILHVIRLVTKSPVNIGNVSIPLWGSVLGIILALYVGYENFKAAK